MRLSKNPITNISADYFDWTPSLKELELNKVDITTFDCSGLHHLQKLYLDYTWLSSFPNITECFSSLVVFSMQYTQGKISTPGIDRALVFGSSLQQKVSMSLTHIHLRVTHIQLVPAWFLHAVPRLASLDLAATKLTEMPDISANYKYVCSKYLWYVCLKYLHRAGPSHNKFGYCENPRTQISLIPCSFWEMFEQNWPSYRTWL